MLSEAQLDARLIFSALPYILAMTALMLRGVFMQEEFSSITVDFTRWVYSNISHNGVL